jgi:hypothetical protein
MMLLPSVQSLPLFSANSELIEAVACKPYHFHIGERFEREYHLDAKGDASFFLCWLVVASCAQFQHIHVKLKN